MNITIFGPPPGLMALTGLNQALENLNASPVITQRQKQQNIMYGWFTRTGLKISGQVQ